MARAKTAPRASTEKSAAAAGAECLLEIGVEELPYQFVAPALRSLAESAERLFKEHRLSHGPVKTVGTPRRLVLMVQDLASHQTPAEKETMGPSKSVAFDQAGQPTKAALGFAASQGIAVSDLEVRATPKGE
jgi:glycyl-tRNA synthetase beta chain